MGAESCHLALYDAARREVVARRPAYTQRTKGVPQYRFPLDASAASTHVIETEQPHLSNDPQSDPLYDPSIKERGVHSVLTAAIAVDRVPDCLLCQKLVNRLLSRNDVCHAYLQFGLMDQGTS